MTSTLIETGRRRVLIENVDPEIDAGEFPIQRTVGRCVVVSADALTDGHDRLSCVLKYRKEEESAWNEVAMEPIGNDRWQAEFRVTETGRYRYTVEAWVDRFQSWREDLKKRVDAGLVVAVELQMGAKLVRGAAQSAAGPDAEQLRAWADSLEREPAEEAVALALSDRLAQQMAAHGDRRLSTVYARELAVVVDRPKAGFSTWYEMFPRSCSPEPGRHGTFRDCEDRLPYIARMGFDVLYLPPIHPIGRTNRKGKNAAPGRLPDDPGSPWAIGAAEGGHKAVHPQLGTLADFDRLVSKAREQGIEVALDLAYQCSPDHPYVGEHPDWFRHRPDGSVQYAENPPKKYEDIYPFDFETEAWRELWEELKDVALFWVRRGVRIFRVDNPHTKPFPFWRWLIGEIKAEYPDVLFLAEAFTRPKVMYDLAKLGFTQSYTYFTWRNTKEQLVRYVSELMETEVREYFRPNLWPNTPDILAEYLQYGGRAGVHRKTGAGRHPGGQLRDLRAGFRVDGESRPRSRAARNIWIRRSTRFGIGTSTAPTASRSSYAGSTRSAVTIPLCSATAISVSTPPVTSSCSATAGQRGRRNAVLVVVNLDPCHMQSGWVELPVRELGIEPDQPYQVHDLLGGARYLWDGPRNFVQLDPATVPAHIFLLRRRVRTERQFDYFM